VSTPPQTSAAPAVDRRRAVAALIALSFATFAFVTTEILPSGLLTLMAPDLGRSTAQIGLLVTGYALVVVVASVPLAHATRRVPRRFLLAGTLAVAAAALLWSALAPSYGQLLAARLVTALAQALFWSVVAAAATGVFPPYERGRMVSRLMVGNAVAPVLGVPFGTWLGYLAGWRAAFLVMSGVCLLVGVAVAALVATVPPEQGGAARGAAPSARNFVLVLVVTALLVTGGLCTFTFVTQYLIEVTGYRQSDLSLILFLQGLAGVLGALAVGQVLDRRPRAAMLGALGMLGVGLVAFWAWGPMPVVAVASLALAGAAFSAIPPTLTHRTMRVAPGNTDIALATNSAVFNLGIAAGSALGAALVTLLSVREVPLAGAVFVAAAVVVVLRDRWR
jgi:predicted MFS family arabinose efflux permease